MAGPTFTTLRLQAGTPPSFRNGKGILRIARTVRLMMGPRCGEKPLKHPSRLRKNVGAASMPIVRLVFVKNAFELAEMLLADIWVVGPLLSSSTGDVI